MSESPVIGPSGSFKYRGDASIVHLNTRKEGPAEEEKVLALDVKLRIKAPADTLLQFSDQTMLDALFLANGAVRNIFLSPIQFTNELEHYRIATQGSSFGGVKLKKFTVEPVDAFGLTVTFIASFQPSADEVARLAEYLSDDIEVLIEPESGELPLAV